MLRRRARGESIADIRKDLVIPTGKRKGQNPSPASIYRALGEQTKREVYPDVVAQAEAEFAELQARTCPTASPQVPDPPDSPGYYGNPGSKAVLDRGAGRRPTRPDQHLWFPSDMIIHRIACLGRRLGPRRLRSQPERRLPLLDRPLRYGWPARHEPPGACRSPWIG